MNISRPLPSALLVTLLLSCLAPAAFAEKVRELPIVDKAIEFHGGDLYRSTTAKLTVSSRSGSFRIVSKMDGESFDHTVTDEGAEESARKVRQTNTSIEEWKGAEAVELDEEGKRRAQSFVEGRVYFPFLPFRLNDSSVWKEDKGLETWDGRQLHRVKVSFDSDSSNSSHDEYTFWFDPETGRLEQYAYSFGTGRERGGLRFRRLYDYQRVGGILFFNALNLGIDGTGDLRVDQIDPDYVLNEMEEVSRVVLSDIEVEPHS